MCKYPPEFLVQAVAPVLNGNRGVCDVARELGINHDTLRNWVTKVRRDRAAGPAASISDELLELDRLRRKVAEFEVEKRS